MLNTKLHGLGLSLCIGQSLTFGPGLPTGKARASGHRELDQSNNRCVFQCLIPSAVARLGFGPRGAQCVCEWAVGACFTYAQACNDLEASSEANALNADVCHNYTGHNYIGHNYIGLV